MVYKVPTSKSTDAANRFEFEVDGEVHSVPLMKYLSVEQVADIEDGGIKAVLRAFGDAAEAVKRLDQEQLEGLTKAWTDASGITLGESPASEAS